MELHKNLSSSTSSTTPQLPDPSANLVVVSGTNTSYHHHSLSSGSVSATSPPNPLLHQNHQNLIHSLLKSPHLPSSSSSMATGVASAAQQQLLATADSLCPPSALLSSSALTPQRLAGNGCLRQSATTGKVRASAVMAALNVGAENGSIAVMKGKAERKFAPY